MMDFMKPPIKKLRMHPTVDPIKIEIMKSEHRKYEGEKLGDPKVRHGATV
jgi:hypothetical protein